MTGLTWCWHQLRLLWLISTDRLVIRVRRRPANMTDMLVQIAARDALSAATWFKPLGGGANGFGACGQAFRDRRWLLEYIRTGVQNMNTTVDSASDARTVNNVMRHEYRVLSDAEKQQMQALKDKGLDFLLYLHHVGDTVPADGRQASRELSIAQTKIEEAVMWAVKHITR